MADTVGDTEDMAVDMEDMAVDMEDMAVGTVDMEMDVVVDMAVVVTMGAAAPRSRGDTESEWGEFRVERVCGVL